MEYAPGAVIASIGLCLLASSLLGLIAVGFLADMEITRVNIGLCNDDRIKAYATITIDDCFVIQGLRLTYSRKKSYFLFMPGRKMPDGTYVDIVHPLDNETRRMIQEKVVAEYEKVANPSQAISTSRT